jgi:mannose-6-phosphate isomerase-like protein (cupin superfamily)
VGTFFVRNRFRILLLLTLIWTQLSAQERTVDPTWLHRYLPTLAEAKTDLSSASCHYKPIFDATEANDRILRSVSRFAEVSVDAGGSCQSVFRDREEEIDLVVEGTGTLRYGDEAQVLGANDFTYLAPGVKHSIANNSLQPLRVLVMDFKIPAQTAIRVPPQHLPVANLNDVKEQTVDGHPNSVLYKLMVGPRGARRDTIDEAYVVTSLFWMDFAPGGTNFPHHHESAEEIYLLLDGEGEMVAGSGIDGVEGRYPAKAGDAYYFRPNCTVGFYNQSKAGTKAHILAVRARIPLRPEED